MLTEGSGRKAKGVVVDRVRRLKASNDLQDQLEMVVEGMRKSARERNGQALIRQREQAAWVYW